MSFKRVNIFIAFLAVSLGIWLRTSSLSDLPLQSDESVNWHLVSSVSEEFAYNPSRFHGPLFFRLLEICDLESQAGIRTVSLISGILLIFAPLLLWSVLNFNQILTACSLFALDAVLIFYSKVAIHEALFNLLCSCFCILILRWLVKREAVLLPLIGLLLGLMIATKETFPLPVLATVVACLLIRPRLSLKEAAGSLAIILAVAILSCSLAFARSDGLILALRGIFEWSKKGVEEVSQHQDWWYFIGLLFLTSPLIFLSAIAVRAKEAKFFWAIGVVFLVVYSIFPYKTPWLSILIVVPFYIVIAQKIDLKFLLPIQLLVIAFPYYLPTLTANSTSRELPLMASKIVTRCESIGESCKVFVNAKWHWPLPYYLRGIRNQVVYSEKPLAIPMREFEVIIVPEVADRDLPGWSKEMVTFSQVQKVNVYFKKRPD